LTARERFRTGRPPPVVATEGASAEPRWRIVGLAAMEGTSSRTKGPEKLLA
jgi:hypothetical protein